ncbi:DNA gyrase inhibitor YacG [Melaminivora alkalimesophila]|uniref:DNA gyrase inhibitor YacG n=1 Tax=Melaminivora alkalimesophila TaxID=1165852 RepID=A0A317RET1_9BURK|nr:DNA gyrase inhibitor YacG [Melaminivora alkalimesophila]PWW48598.1 hypothetical protein DFR36_101101 [Melaminivora alkalimesophila]
MASDTPAPPSPTPPAREVRCPCCGGPSLYGPQNPFRPFCSRRCRQIDLGAWANEEFRVPAETPAQDAPYGDPRHEP